MKFIIAGLIVIATLSIIAGFHISLPQDETPAPRKPKYICTDKKCRTEIETSRTH